MRAAAADEPAAEARASDRPPLCYICLFAHDSRAPDRAGATEMLHCSTSIVPLETAWREAAPERLPLHPELDARNN